MAPHVTLTCLIPAYNEAPRIAGVLAAVVGHPALQAVLVVDDGSTDGTGDVARGFGVAVMRTAGNLGKTAALAQALAQVETTHVLLLDADLIGLTAADVTALIAYIQTLSAMPMPIAEGATKGNAPIGDMGGQEPVRAVGAMANEKPAMNASPSPGNLAVGAMAEQEKHKSNP